MTANQKIRVLTQNEVSEEEAVHFMEGTWLTREGPETCRAMEENNALKKFTVCRP